MALDPIISQGIRPIGADLPEIANMLYQRQQQNTQNALIQKQSALADKQQAGVDETQRSLQTIAEAAHLSTVPDEQLAPTISHYYPHVAQAMQQAGIAPDNTPAIRQLIGHVKGQAESYLGVPPAEPKFQTVAPGSSYGTVNDQGVFTQGGTVPLQANPQEQDRLKFQRDQLAETVRHNRAQEGKDNPLGMAAPGAAVGGAPAGGMQGDQFISTLPANIGAQVRALADGRMAFPSGFALKTPYWQQMISAVSQYDPSFDAVNFNARAKTRASFTSGADSTNVTAIGTAIHHLVNLKDAYDKLDNTNMAWLNSGINATEAAFGNKAKQTALADVGAKAIAVAHELASVFRRSGMSESEIRDWQSKINTNATPSSSDSIINSALDLMNGRLYELGDKYSRGMGRTEDIFTLMSPEARAGYDKLRGSAAPGGASATAPAVDAQPATGAAAPAPLQSAPMSAPQSGWIVNKVRP